MKRLCLPVLLLLCLLLSACGDRAGEERFREFSDALAQQETLSFTAALRAEYEDKTVEYTLRYEEGPEGALITVLSPELLAGIKARLAGDGAALEYDGLVIDTGDLDSRGLTPISALPALVETLRSGHLESYWTEEGRALFQLIADDELSAVVRFEPETMTPLRAELISGGHVRVVCDLAGWGTAAPEEDPAEDSA